MRRIGTTGATLAIAGLFALAAPGQALAAHGDLVLNGVVHPDPTGCFNAQRVTDAVNNTDTPALVYGGADCTGKVIAVIWQNKEWVLDPGDSVYMR
ncbi:hypothetical protein [Streptomyces rubradiris]|uniref:Secreted protein n=1 Tax=Streptomyces rubradiris TaxID=285531 RepID=A0ABQ3RFA4_STRRR|nr:hypothetical protein [Streptomyces rubradiris]GHG97017.1 hypothetical protein GCM10018792_08560 [Streptomyces rubradiris]GHI54526.1 hypothetical protein Srubr_43720 [Streptomyces rubradiris]